jgi:hypothetical protein
MMTAEEVKVNETTAAPAEVQAAPSWTPDEEKLLALYIEGFNMTRTKAILKMRGLQKTGLTALEILNAGVVDAKSARAEAKAKKSAANNPTIAAAVNAL